MKQLLFTFHGSISKIYKISTFIKVLTSIHTNINKHFMEILTKYTNIDKIRNCASIHFVT